MAILSWVTALTLSLALSPALAAAPPARSPVTAPAPEEGVWPITPPEVTDGFDPPAERWLAGHRGVDLVGRVGQPVRSALPGRVGYAGRIAGRGVVVVDHGGRRTTYQPVDALVSPGDRVRAGEVLGTLELLGSHCWPRACLHWGLRAGETYLDPLTLVGAGPVRLLPLTAGAPADRPVQPGWLLTASSVWSERHPVPPPRVWWADRRLR